MITEIGITAGEIWHYLDRNDQTTLSNLTDNIERPRDTLLMSLGWLAREGHVVMQQSEEDYTLYLRKHT